MGVDKVYYVEVHGSDWWIWEIARVDVTVAVDASKSKTLHVNGISGTGNPIASDPTEPEYRGAYMHLDVTITDQHALDCACKTSHASVGWMQTKAIPGKTQSSDHPGLDFYQKGQNFTDYPGVDHGKPSDLNFVTTLHCRNEVKTLLATFAWSVHWDRIKEDTYKGTLTWSQLIQSNTGPQNLD
jgi:hypothetical protein